MFVHYVREIKDASLRVFGVTFHNAFAAVPLKAAYRLSSASVPCVEELRTGMSQVSFSKFIVQKSDQNFLFFYRPFHKSRRTIFVCV